MLEDDNSQQAAHQEFLQMYDKNYDRMKEEIETTHYFHDYIIAKYLYKGFGIEKETRRLLRQYDDFSRWIDGYTPEDKQTNSVSIVNARRGQFALLFALVHPDVEVHSYATDADDAALAACCEPLPQNLHIHACEEGMPDVTAAGSNTINLTEILACKE